MNVEGKPQAQYHEFNLKDLLPQSWLKGKNTIWIRSYLSLGFEKNMFPTGPKVIDLDDVRVILLYGSTPYTKMNLEVESSETPVFKYFFSQGMTPKGGHLLLITPYKDNKNTNEIIDEKAGFLTLFWSHNALYKKLFDNILTIPEMSVSGLGPVFMNPATFPKPIISEEAIRCIKDAHTNFIKLDLFIRNRIQLSLAWFHQSFHTLGIDMFLKRWFAIEALAMSEQENIKPLNQILAKAYNITYSEAVQQFGLGKIYGFRCDIVHRGKIYSIHSLLTDYLEAIYCDVIYEILHISPQFKAQRLIEKDNFDLGYLLKFED